MSTSTRINGSTGQINVPKLWSIDGRAEAHWQLLAVSHDPKGVVVTDPTITVEEVLMETAYQPYVLRAT